jgi:hypothetical protein
MLPLLLFAMAAGDDPLKAKPVPDAVLAQERGGFSLPGGLDVALTVQTQTAIDGKVVLTTVFKAVEGAPAFTAYVPRPGETVVSHTASGADGAQSAQTMPTVVIDGRNGIRVTPGVAPPVVSIGGGTGDAGGGVPAGLVEAGAGAVTDAGTIGGNSSSGSLRTIELQGADINVTHLAGSAFGSAIANSGSDRAIDTTTSVGIDLQNAGPDNLGSTMFRVENVAIDALTSRIN